MNIKTSYPAVWTTEDLLLLKIAFEVFLDNVLKPNSTNNHNFYLICSYEI